jgi:hypothetical protein
MTSESNQENTFRRHISATQALLRRYNSLDAAIALSVSELWPPNAGSPVKHVFAWRALLEMPCDTKEGAAIASYADFKRFTEALYTTLPEFPMLEDFAPEADWGQTRVRLDRDFVPVFYGSCIERTPDFIEAFRITYAAVPEAQTQMNLAIALQAQIIQSIPWMNTDRAFEAQPGHSEVPPEDFWLACNSALKQVGTNIIDWRAQTKYQLEVHFGDFKAPATLDAFADAVMNGAALPFLAVERDGIWVPMSIRSAPALIIDHWAGGKSADVSPQAHQKLAHFVAERFQGTIWGPLTLFLGDTPCEGLPVSCIISANSGIYLICACDHASAERLAIEAKGVYEKIRNGAPLHFRLTKRGRFMLSEDGTGPSAEEIHIIIVATQASTALSSILAPERPTRLLPLADLITIFDSMSDLNELERYWEFVDGQRSFLSPLSSGSADLFASFKDTDGVLVEGAISPTYIALDPHWGTSWRFQVLADFWSHAPKVFPDGSSGWWLSPHTKGVIELESRHHNAVAYSTSVGSCTIQVLMRIGKDLRIEDAELVNLFAQLLADCFNLCGKFMSDLPLLRRPHILFTCEADPAHSVDAQETPLSIDDFARVITSVEEDPDRPALLQLKVNSRAVLAGLSGAQDKSFEIRCMLETIERWHATYQMELPSGFAERLSSETSKPARYHLSVIPRNVDVPDYVEPTIPSPTDYKLARRHLATKIRELGLSPGRYELSEAKAKVDAARDRLRVFIESRLASFDSDQLNKAFIEQHDALLVAERMRIQRTRQSLSHEVDYDRIDAVEQARKELGTAARHYRYLLEKVISSPTSGSADVKDNALRELVALVDWLMVLAGTSDVLHNEIDVGGVEIDDSYLPEVFFSRGSDEWRMEFAREHARYRLGLGASDSDTVEGESESLLTSEELKSAFRADLGFDLQSLLTVLLVLSQPHRHGLGKDLSLSYTACQNHLAKKLSESIEGLDISESTRIITFLTLSSSGIRRLPGKDVDEADVPYWEHNKRIHRYTIRPLVSDGKTLRWGAETASRAMHIWMSTVRDGRLPADFGWRHVEPLIREIKKSIEKRLELRAEEIFQRHTPFVLRGVDFYRQFRAYNFDDVGDFDVFAYWPDINLLVTVECKYNQPSHTMKDGRRLRDKMFGKAEDDHAGQFSRIRRRRRFVEQNRTKLLELLNWPISDAPIKDVELYVSRDVFYWMVNPPYFVPTQFVRVDVLETWIRTELAKSQHHV